jgi:hypothetical protein
MTCNFTYLNNQLFFHHINPTVSTHGQQKQVFLHPINFVLAPRRTAAAGMGMVRRAVPDGRGAAEVRAGLQPVQRRADGGPRGRSGRVCSADHHLKYTSCNR